MLQQRLPIVDRPRSQIAGEYRRLAAAIAFKNFEDRDGAVAVLDSAVANVRFDPDAFSGPSLASDLQKTARSTPTDKEIFTSPCPSQKNAAQDGRVTLSV